MRTLADNKAGLRRAPIGNEEAIAINQQYAGHPGMRVKAWIPTTPPIEKYYRVIGSIGHTGEQESCSKGWKINKDAATISTPPIPAAAAGQRSEDGRGSIRKSPRCLSYVPPSSSSSLLSASSAPAAAAFDDASISGTPAPLSRWLRTAPILNLDRTYE